jgi:hypothetical protein
VRRALHRQRRRVLRRQRRVARPHQRAFSPTHKRTEGRASVWGSEFTSKVAKLQGWSIRNRCWAKCKILGSGGSGELLPIEPIEPSPLFECIWTFESDFESIPKKLKTDEERTVSNLESTPKESTRSWGQAKFCFLPLGCGRALRTGGHSAMASLGCGGAMRAITRSIPPHTCLRQV